MSSTTPVKKALTGLDHRVEAAMGRSVDQLWEQGRRGLLDDPSLRLVDTHRALAGAETSVTFYRVLLHRLTSGEFPVDHALFARIDRTVGQLKEAAEARDACQERMLTALEPVEAAHARKVQSGLDLSAAEFAALLAIAQGAKLHHHLLTGRLSLATASGARVAPSMLERLEEAGLVTRDFSHAVQAGQPVTVTAAGRTALTSTHRPRKPAAAPAQPAGTWPGAGRTPH